MCVFKVNTTTRKLILPRVASAWRVFARILGQMTRGRSLLLMLLLLLMLMIPVVNPWLLVVTHHRSLEGKRKALVEPPVGATLAVRTVIVVTGGRSATSSPIG